MSQHDFNIANQGFPATRADLNNALAALASNSSGTSEPSTTYAGQFWNDTTNSLLKFRNDANDGWITFAKLDQATNEWEVRSSVFQAVDSAGIAFKTDEGTTRATLGDDGNWVFTGGATFSGALASSTLKVSEIIATGETAGRAVSGIAAAWVNFDGHATASIRDSMNVASLTDNGTGDYTVAFTNSMSNGVYASTANVCEGGFRFVTISSARTSAAGHGILIGNTSQNASDQNTMAQTHGDLA